MNLAAKRIIESQSTVIDLQRFLALQDLCGASVLGCNLLVV